MSEKEPNKPTKKRQTRKQKQDDDTGGNVAGRTNGGTSTDEMVDLGAYLTEISARLVTAGSIAMTRPQPIESEPVERMQVLVFALDNARYAVELSHVGEVVRRPNITRVPGLPGWVLGVTNLHGEIISLVDIRLFLEVGSPSTKHPPDMLVAQTDDQRIGLMVDDIEVIYAFPVDQVLSPPFKVEPGLVAYLRGAFEHKDGFVRLLDCEQLLLGPKMQQFS